MKNFVQFLMIIMFVWTNGMIANINESIAEESKTLDVYKERIIELTKTMKKYKFNNNPAVIQNIAKKTLFPEIYGAQKGNTFQTEMLNGLRYYTLEQEWDINSSAWEDHYQTYYTYDGSGNLTQSLSQVWQFAWVDQMRETLTYDGSGNNLTWVLEMWTGTAWMTFMSMTYTYNPQGYLTQMLTSFMYGTEERATMIYDANWYVIEALWEMYDGFNWVNNELYSFTNNASGAPLEELRQLWNGSAWVDTTKYNYTYNGNNDITQSIKQIWTGIAWVNYDKETWSYDGNFNNTEYLLQIWNGSAWENDEKYTWTYDANNNLVEDLSQYWDGAAWVNEDKGMLTYNGNNDCTEELWQYWSSGNWVNSDKLMHQYTPVGGIDDYSNLIPDDLSLSNYPNPFNPQTNIKFYFPKASEISIKIYNIEGELIRTLINGQKWNAGEHTIQWNGTDYNNQVVSSGTYFIHFQSEKYNLVNRCLLIK